MEKKNIQEKKLTMKIFPTAVGAADNFNCVLENSDE